MGRTKVNRLTCAPLPQGKQPVTNSHIPIQVSMEGHGNDYIGREVRRRVDRRYAVMTESRHFVKALIDTEIATVHQKE